MVRIGNDADDTSSTSTDEEEFINSITPQVPKKTIVIQRLDSEEALDIAIKDTSPPNQRNDTTVEVNDDIKDTPQSHSNMLIEAGRESNISLVKVEDANYPNAFNVLPDEILLRIYSFIDIPSIGKMAQVCKRFHRIGDDLPLWRKLTFDRTNILDTNSEATRSYYIKKYKQHKELSKRRLEEEKRQLALEKLMREEDRCASIMTWLAFNRVYEWAIFFGFLFTTITTVLKLDNHIDWNWAIILTPLFFTVLQFLYAPLMYDAASVYYQKNFEDRIADENKYCGPILYLIMFMMPLGNTSDSKRRMIVYVNAVCTVVFVILFALRISTSLELPWWGVFVPLLVQASFLIAVTVVGYYYRIWEDDQWLDRAVVIVMTGTLMLTFIFLFLKLDGSVDWSWYLVLIPLFVLKGFFIVIPCFMTGISIFGSYTLRSRTRWSDDVSAYCIVATMVAFLLIGPLLVFIVLLAQHAEGDTDISFTLVFVPVFIIEGCGCIGCVILNVVASSD